MINIQTYGKQYEALQYLMDDTTTEILFGGAVYTGKSYLACLYAITMSLKYPGSRGAICRARLTNLVKSTYATFNDLMHKLGLVDQYKYNSQTHIITFDNGSQIYLLDLFPLPGDPNYTRFGGYELTWVIIDECAECPLKAFQVLKTRVRYKLKENGLVGKILLCSNPTTGWLKEMFYDNWKNGTLPKHRKFVQALPHENPFADKKVLEQYSIENLGELYYRMLVLGDWSYTTTDSDLYNYDDLVNMFYVNAVPGSKYISVDCAGQGVDKTCITVWNNYQCISIQLYPKTTVPQIVNHVKNNMIAHSVKVSNVIVDAGGLGQGVADLLVGCKKFLANSRPLKGEKGFYSLKDQLAFKFASLLKDGKIGISSIEANSKQEIVREFQAHKMFRVDREKAQVTPKSLVRQHIGRSPDSFDALIMRMWFEYKTQSGLIKISGF